jgi:hypothetical protein
METLNLRVHLHSILWQTALYAGFLPSSKITWPLALNNAASKMTIISNSFPAMGIAHENCEREQKDDWETLKLLVDKSAHIGKGKEKSSKPDKPHHSDNPDWKKKPSTRSPTSNLADTLSIGTKQPIPDFAIALKSIPDNL